MSLTVIFMLSFHTDLQKINAVSITTICSLRRLLCRNVVDDSKYTRKSEGQNGCREGGAGRITARYTLSSPTTAGPPFSCRCAPHQMPIHGASGCWDAGGRQEGGSHLHKAEVFAVLLTERRGEGGMVRDREGGRDVKRNARNVIMSSSCLKSAGAPQSECHYRCNLLCPCTALLLHRYSLSHTQAATGKS